MAGAAYQMSLRPGGDGQPAPPDWVMFNPPMFILAAGGEQVVQAAVVVPPGAMDGHYAGLLAAEIIEEGDGDRAATGAGVGAAAATRLDFQVVPASLLSGWMNVIRRVLTNTTPWSGIALGGAALAVLLWWLSRRFHLRVERIVRS